jgi:raffinose/stachyose/melibiose transport system permease protein
MLISSVFQIGFSLVIAGILDYVGFRKWQKLFRTIYFLPSLLMVTVVGLVFRILYSPSLGLVNPLLDVLGFRHENLDLLGNASTAIYAVIAMSQWQYIGFTVMLFCVSMQSVPSQLMEAADIDGAGVLRKFFQIVLPQIRSTIAINWIIIVSGSIKVFDEVFVTTSGGPGRATETLATFLYRSGFKNDEMGYASTIALILFLGTFLLGMIQMKSYQVEEIG